MRLRMAHFEISSYIPPILDPSLKVIISDDTKNPKVKRQLYCAINLNIYVRLLASPVMQFICSKISKWFKLVRPREIPKCY